MGAAGQLTQRALAPAGLRLQGPFLQPPSPLPSVIVLLTDSYLPAAGHAPQQPTTDKMLM